MFNYLTAIEASKRLDRQEILSQDERESYDFARDFVGFVGGEGTFSLHRFKNSGKEKRVSSVAFHIKCRIDEADYFFRVREFFGFGNVLFYDHSRYRLNGRNMQDQVGFSLWGGNRCMVIVRLFTAFELQQKKQTAFAIWAEAVRFLIRIRRVEPVRYSPRTIERINAFCTAMKVANSYNAAQIPIHIFREDPQRLLFADDADDPVGDSILRVG